MNIEYWSQLGTNSKSLLIFSDAGAPLLDGIKVSRVLVNAYISLIKNKLYKLKHKMYSLAATD